MSKLLDEFRSRGVSRGGLLLLPAATAISLVRRCRELEVPVLGLDGFRLTDTSTQPILEDSIDLSSDSAGLTLSTSWDAAEQFLNERLNSGLLFEVVVDDA